MKHKTIFEDILLYLSKVKPVKELIEDIKFLIAAIKENPIKYGAIGISALMYFLSPVDAVPDVIPIAGLSDDVAIVAAAVGAIKRMMGK